MGDDWKPTVPERPSSRDSKPAGEPEPASREAPTPLPDARYVGGVEIARGGMGRVIEATDTLLARTVAVKEALTRDPEALRRFARETRITARLEHPSIVPVYDAGTDPESPFYVMRRVSGRPLSGMVAAADSLVQRLALLPHVLASAQAIAHAHKRGVIHRDIKPSNILVGELGETVVIDWGIAKVIGEADIDDVQPPLASDSLRTRIGTVSGTPGFMSPEQARGDDVGTSSDVWALGATLYYVLSRQMPHEQNAKTPDDLLALAAYRRVPPIASVVAGVPPELAAITERALAFEIADRFPDAASFAEELSRFLTGQIVASHRYSMRERLVRWVKRNRALVAVAVVAIVLIGAVSTLSLRRVLEERERANQSARDAEAARAKEQAHAEAELLARARAIATTQPTAAIAALANLPATSPLGGEADAIRATAISHGGAAWGITRNSGPIAVLEMDPTMTMVASLSYDGQLQIWDLDRHELLVEEAVHGEYPVWTERGLLLCGEEGSRILAPRTRTWRPLPDLHITMAKASVDGRSVAVIDVNGNAGWLDLESGTVRTVAMSTKVGMITLPDDGQWLVAVSKDALGVFDRDGTPLVQRTGEVRWVAASRSRHLTVVADERMFELEVTKGGEWRERPNPAILWPAYVDETLVGRSATSIYIYAKDPARPPIQLGKLGGLSTAMVQVGDGILSFGSGSIAGTLFYVDQARTFEIPLPEALVQPRLASRPGSTRVVVAGNSSLIEIDLRHVIPRLRSDLPSRSAQYVTNEDVLTKDDGGGWVLRRAPNHTWPLDRISPYGAVVDVYRGRALIADFPLEPTHFSVLDVAKMNVTEVTARYGRLLDGGALFISSSRLLRRRDTDDVAHEIATLPSQEAAIAVDRSRFLVFTNDEILRGDLEAGVVERRPFAAIQGGVLLLVEDRLLVASGKELHWDSATGPLLVTMEDNIDELYRARGGVILKLASKVTVFAAFASDGTVTTHHLSTMTFTDTGMTGRLLAPSSNGTEMIELPSRRHWLHPIQNPLAQHLSMRPDAEGLLELGLDGRWWEWQLLPVGLNLAHHTTTNAREQDDRTLLWPWQQR